MKAIVPLVLVFVLPILLLVGSTLYLGILWDTDAPLSVAVIGSGLLAFVFFISLLRHNLRTSSEGVLRGAIATAIVVQYLVLVGIVAFFGRGPEQLPPITQTMISSFTTIVGVVVAFYFGSSAYVEAEKSKATVSGIPSEKREGSLHSD